MGASKNPIKFSIFCLIKPGGKETTVKQVKKYDYCPYFYAFFEKGHSYPVIRFFPFKNLYLQKL